MKKKSFCFFGKDSRKSKKIFSLGKKTSMDVFVPASGRNKRSYTSG